ncbi:MAG: class I SAM-dependent methyltransferase [Myxococcales bacterium]|nr:class I SAM-dependent methyltransferase [Myxococcales bacterium]
MALYDVFSKFYDASVERLYVEHRELAALALDAAAGHKVLDVPCGTGQSFAHLVPGKVGGALIGVDSSAGMLKRAEARVEQESWAGVHLLQRSATALSADDLQGLCPVDRLHIFLGMSVFDVMDGTFDHLWSLLAPGGRCVVVDVHAERPGLQGKLVNLIAGADIRRRFWEPLERVCADFELRDLPHHPKHGGQIMLASGRKPLARM